MESNIRRIILIEPLEDVIEFYNKISKSRNISKQLFHIAAEYGRLDIIKYLYSTKQIKKLSVLWYYAVILGYMEMMEWLHENKIHYVLAAEQAFSAKIQIIEWLHEHNYLSTYVNICYFAINTNKVDILTFLIEKGYSCGRAEYNEAEGKDEILQVLHDHQITKEWPCESGEYCKYCFLRCEILLKCKDGYIEWLSTDILIRLTDDLCSIQSNYYKWSMTGWKQLTYEKDHVTRLLREHKDTSDHNWYKYFNYRFSYPVVEMVEQYNLKEGDICSIKKIDPGDYNERSSCKRFTIIRFIVDDEDFSDIRGGRKKKFFYQ